MKFHLTAIFTNLVLIFSIMHLSTFVIVKTIDYLYFVKKGYYFEDYFVYLLFVFSWASTFLIYIIKKQSSHLYYFLLFNFMVLIILNIIGFITSNDFNSRPFELSNLLISLKSAIVECIIPIIIVSICVNISQNFIGKKLLPERYF